MRSLLSTHTAGLDFLSWGPAPYLSKNKEMILHIKDTTAKKIQAQFSFLSTRDAGSEWDGDPIGF